MIFNSEKEFKFDGPTIIYCLTKQACTDVNDALKTMRLKSDIYHAGISIEKRRKAQVDFTNDNIDVKIYF
jgi:superfamily II DNA helicase RecQ